MTCSWNLSCRSRFLKVFSISVATCNYIRYGRGGGQEIKNAICVLGLNMINDKVLIVTINPFHLSISGVCNPMALALHSHLCRVEQVSCYPSYHILVPCYLRLRILIFAGSNRCGRFVLISWRVSGGIFCLLLWAVGSQKPKTQQIISRFQEWSHAWSRLSFLCFQDLQIMILPVLQDYHSLMNIIVSPSKTNISRSLHQFCRMLDGFPELRMAPIICSNFFLMNTNYHFQNHLISLPSPEK